MIDGREEISHEIHEAHEKEEIGDKWEGFPVTFSAEGMLFPRSRYPKSELVQSVFLHFFACFVYFVVNLLVFAFLIPSLLRGRSKEFAVAPSEDTQGCRRSA